MSEPVLSPPPPPGPPGPPGSPSPPTPPIPPASGPGVRISEWYSQAWQVLQPVWVEVLLAGLVFQLVLLAATFACLVPAFVVAGPLIGGLHVYLAKRLVGLPAEVGDVFKGFRRFLDTFLLGAIILLPPLIVAVILIGVPIALTLGLGTIGGPLENLVPIAANLGGCVSMVAIPLFLFVYPVLVGTLLVFAMPLVLFKGMGAMAAIRRSVELVRADFGNFLLLLLANVVILLAAQSVGSTLLCVGWLVLSPVATGFVYLVQLIAYRDHVGLTQADLAPYA